MSVLARNVHTPVDATAGTVTVTLPTAGVVYGDEVSAEKFDTSTHPVVISGSIRGQSDAQVSLAVAHEAATFRYDGVSWWPINGGAPSRDLGTAYATFNTASGQLEQAGTPIPVGGNSPVAATGAPTARPSSDRAGDAVSLDDWVGAATGGDWNLALRAALDYATPLGRAIILNRIYPCLTTLQLKTADHIIGRGRRAGLINNSGAPMRLINGDNTASNPPSNVTLDNLTLDGNVTTGTTTNRRIIQLSDADNITFTRMNVVNGSDWHTSFVRCTNVRVTDYRCRTHPSMLVSAYAGGCDGIHFLDCSNWSVIGADIVSGDDCVAATVQTVGMTGGVVRGVVGSSTIASIVTIGYELMAPNTTITTKAITIDGITSISPTALQDSVVKVVTQGIDTAGNLTVTHNLTDVTVTDVRGVSAAHGIYIKGTAAAVASSVRVRNIDVVSTKQHGCYLAQVTDYVVHGRAVALGQGSSPLFSGFAALTCGVGTWEPNSSGSSLYGLQMQNCGKTTIISPHLWNCGGGSSSDGGGIRLFTPAGPVNVLPGSIGADTAGVSTFGVRCDPTSQPVTIAPTMELTTNVATPVNASMRGAWKAPTVTAAAPTTTDDASKGYTLGHVWINTAATPRTAKVLVDNTAGAAVWA